MSPHNFSRKRIDNYIYHPNFVNTPSGQNEKKVEMFVYRVFGKVLSIPADFRRRISEKKITKGQKNSQKLGGIPNNLFDDLDSFEE